MPREGWPASALMLPEIEFSYKQHSGILNNSSRNNKYLNTSNQIRAFLLKLDPDFTL